MTCTEPVRKGSKNDDSQTLPFCKFQKIYGSIDQYGIEKNLLQKLLVGDHTWTVQEKVHGSNFSIYYDGQAVKYAKRTGFLDFENDWFYNFQQRADFFERAIKRLHAELARDSDVSSEGLYGLVAKPSSEDAAATLQLVVYGELYGGFYPDGETTDWDAVLGTRIDAKTGRCTVPTADRAVQEGIYYAKKLSFMAFDVAYRWVGSSPGEERSCSQKLHFLSAVAFAKLSAVLACRHSDFRFARALLTTRDYGKVMDYDLEFATTMADDVQCGEMPAGLTGAPAGTTKKVSHKSAKKNIENASPHCHNVAEGIVIRSDMVLNQQALDEGRAVIPIRCLLKRKNPRFQEEIEDIDVEFSAAEIKRSFQFVFSKLVNQNRLNGVVSKTEGRITAENMERVVQALMDDVLEDFYANPAYCGQCIIQDTEVAENFLRELCADCVRLADAIGE